MPVVNDNKIDLAGTQGRGSFYCTVGAAQAAFGTDGAFPKDMSGSAMVWAFKDSGGNRWSIYDHKLTDYYSVEEIRYEMLGEEIPLFVGGDKNANPTEFKNYLKGKFKEGELSYLEIREE